MSLLDEAYEPFVMIDKRSISDGEGSFFVDYVDGAKISVCVTNDNTSLTRIAEALAEKVEYRVITKKNIKFSQDDLIKRLSDGQVFRIYYKNTKETPKSANLDMRETFAQEWSIPI
jgi:hypothetical protein